MTNIKYEVLRSYYETLNEKYEEFIEHIKPACMYEALTIGCTPESCEKGDKLTNDINYYKRLIEKLKKEIEDEITL